MWEEYLEELETEAVPPTAFLHVSILHSSKMKCDTQYFSCWKNDHCMCVCFISISSINSLCC